MSIEKVVRNDFTVAELEEAFESGQVIVTNYVENPDYVDQSEAWSRLSYAERKDRPAKDRPSYYLKDENGDALIESVELVNVEEDEDVSFYEIPDYFHGLGHFKQVESWNLGDGHECGVLFQHVESGRLFRKTGWYSSWDSGDWDGPMEEVVPANVTVVRYVPKDKPDAIPYEHPAVTV